MTTFATIAIAQSTDVMRRSLRGSGPSDDAVAPAVPERPRSAATLRRLARGSAGTRQSGSDQCSIVAAPRKPARA